MSLRVTCPFCLARLKLPTAAVGRRCRCPRCAANLRTELHAAAREATLGAGPEVPLPPPRGRHEHDRLAQATAEALARIDEAAARLADLRRAWSRLARRRGAKP